MESILAIFNKLGVDYSFYYQFALFLILFVILKYLFFNKVQFIIELRESKTNGLIKNANNKFNKGMKIADECKEKIDNTHAKVQEELRSHKKNICTKEYKDYSKEEIRIMSEFDEERSKLHQEAMERQKEAIGKVDEFSNELVKKLT